MDKQEKIPPKWNRSLNKQPLTQTQEDVQLDRDFIKGKAFFEKLKDNATQVYSDYRKLKLEEMMISINNLEFWKQMGGPKNQSDIEQSQIYLTDLQAFKQSKIQGGIEFSLRDWFNSIRSSVSSFQKPIASKKNSTATIGSESSSSQVYGQSRKQAKGGKTQIEQEEAAPLKGQ